MYLSDISAHQLAYNKFEINEADYNFKAGFYEYQVYQMPYGGSEDETLGYLVETGMLRVISQDIVKVVHKSENKVYGR